MKKRMNLKKSKKKKKFMIYIFIFLLVSSFTLTIKSLNNKIEINNQEFIKYILYSSNHSISYESNYKKITTNIVKFLTNITFTDPSSIIKDEYEEKKDVEKINSKYIEDPYPNKTINSPEVYLYNTHQLEEYSYKKYEKYNVVPNVLMASYIFREKLNNLSVPTIVETTDVSEILRINSWKYYKSYDVTRMLINSAREKYPSLKYFIDIHRDSVSHNKSYININDVNYAKILFIIGLENKNYRQNLEFTEKFNNLINKKYKGLSRGIYKKEGKGVNGVYNQDIDEHVMLIEIGGEENSIEEVTNTINVLSELFFEYIGDDK